MRRDMEAAIKSMAEDQLRTLTVAYKELDGTENLEEVDEQGIYSVEKTNFVLFAILGIKDVLRENVKESVKRC